MATYHRHYLLLLPRSNLSTLFPYTTLFRSIMSIDVVEVVIWRESSVSGGSGAVQMFLRWQQRKNIWTAPLPPETELSRQMTDRKSGSAGMPRPISYAVFCLKKKKKKRNDDN